MARRTFSKVVETNYPIVVSILLSVSLFIAFKDRPNFEKVIDGLVTNGLSITGVMLGFLLTIATVINTISTGAMNFMRQAGSDMLLYRYLKVAIGASLTAIVVFYLHPFLLSIAEPFTTCCEWYYLVLIWLTAWFIATTIRLVLLFIRVIH